MAKINVAYVDDSPFMRRVIAEIIGRDEELNILGSFSNGQEFLDKFKSMKPDVVVLDYNMPGMNGVEVLREMMKVRPTPAVMLTGHIEANSEESLQAYEAGAVSIVFKPGGSYSLSLKDISEELITEIKNASLVDPKKIQKNINMTLENLLAKPKLKVDYPLIVIGASTGGPTVLEQIVSALPHDLNAAIMIAQHMPKGLTQLMARRLSIISAVNVLLAEDGMAIKGGNVYIAPGNNHILISQNTFGQPVISVKDAIEFANIDTPSIDMLFESAAHYFGNRTIGFVLSGTGQDALVGSKMIKQVKGKVYVQEPDSALVANMIMNILSHDLADGRLEVPNIVKRILDAGRKS